MPVLLRTFAVGAALILVLAGCILASPGATGTTSPGGTGGPGDSAASEEPLQSLGPPPSPTPPDQSAAVVIDPTLLGVLPESIDDTPVAEDVNEAAIALNSSATATLAEALDAAVAVNSGSGDVVTALVVRMRPDAFTDAAYAQWRDSYDEGACAAAGGVVGRAEAQIAERRTFITSCVTGWRTYHVWLEEQRILVSASSLGEGRFGEKLMEGLRVPG